MLITGDLKGPPHRRQEAGGAPAVSLWLVIGLVIGRTVTRRAV